MEVSEVGSPFQAVTEFSPAASPFQVTRRLSAWLGSPVFQPLMVVSADGSPAFQATGVGMMPASAAGAAVVATFGFSFQSAGEEDVTRALGASDGPPFQAVWVVMWRSNRVR